MKKRRGKSKAKKRRDRRGVAAASQGGTEFHEHLKLARKLVKKLRKRVARLGRKAKSRRRKK
jgi:hypothetical protein